MVGFTKRCRLLLNRGTSSPRYRPFACIDVKLVGKAQRLFAAGLNLKGAFQTNGKRAHDPSATLIAPSSDSKRSSGRRLSSRRPRTKYPRALSSKRGYVSVPLLPMHMSSAINTLVLGP